MWLQGPPNPARRQSGSVDRLTTSSSGLVTFMVPAEQKFNDHKCMACEHVAASHNTLCTHMIEKHRIKIDRYLCSICKNYPLPSENITGSFQGVRVHMVTCRKRNRNISVTSPTLDTRAPIDISPSVIISATKPVQTSTSEVPSLNPAAQVSSPEPSVRPKTPEKDLFATTTFVIATPSPVSQRGETTDTPGDPEIMDTPGTPPRYSDLRRIHEHTVSSGADNDSDDNDDTAGVFPLAVGEAQRESEHADFPGSVSNPITLSDDDDASWCCTHCSRRFDCELGLIAHTRQKHSVEWNRSKVERLDANTKQKRDFWTDTEYDKLAELLKSKPEERSKNDFLESNLSLFPNRNIAALLRASVNPQFKEAVERLEKRLEQSLHENSLDESPSPERETDEDDTLFYNALAPLVTEITLMGEQYKEFVDGLEKVIEKRIAHLQGAVATDEVQSALDVLYTHFQKITVPPAKRRARRTPGRQTNAEKVRLSDKRKISRHRRGESYSRPEHIKTKTKVTERTKRTFREKRSDYARHQQLWHRSKTKLWDNVKNGWPLERGLDLGQATEFWRAYFGKLSPEDTEHIRNLSNDEVTGVWLPLSPEEVRKALLQQRGKAIGVDLVRFDELNRIPIALLLAFLDCCLWCCSVPGPLNRSRTVLIPKNSSGASTNPADYRPITISPVVVRVLNSVLAHRMLARTRLHFSQRGFIKADGCLENTGLLNWIIRHSIQRNSGSVILSLDVRKAFDSVSHHSIIRALRGHRFSSHVIEYIRNGLTNSTTRICIGGNSSPEFPVLSGVKQGDPLSPLLFNLVIDELLRDLHGEKVSKHLGYPLLKGDSLANKQRIPAIAFADDIVLCTEDEAQMQIMADYCEEFYRKRGMSLNPSKSVLLRRVTAPKAQTTAIGLRSRIIIADERPRILTRGTDVFNYLGVEFSPMGLSEVSKERLGNLLDRLGAAPLKPEQKMYFLRQHLIPSLLHETVLGRIRVGILQEWDMRIKKFIKETLHLYRWAIDGLIYLPINRGGLGIPNLALMVPRILLNRLRNLASKSDNPWIQSWVLSRNYKDLVELCTTFLTKTDGSQTNCLDSLDRYTRYWLGKAKGTWDGKGVDEYSKVKGVGNSWLHSGDRFLSGKRFVRAVQLRFNALPCAANSARHLRGDPNSVNIAMCRYKCNEKETVNHISNHCYYDGKHMIRKRHDDLLRDLAAELTRAGHTVATEMSFMTSEGVVRPDICLRTHDSSAIYILDVACPFNTGEYSYSHSAQWKKNKYNKPDIQVQIRKYFGVEADTVVHVNGISFGARGGIAPTSYETLKQLLISKNRMNLWSTLTIMRSVEVWEHYQRGQYWNRMTNRRLGRWKKGEQSSTA